MAKNKKFYFPNERGGVSSTSGKQKRGTKRYQNESFGQTYGKFDTPDQLYSASKTNNGKTSSYLAVTNGKANDKGTIRNNKKLREAKEQLRRIKASSDGSERHQQLVDRAQRAVDAYTAYKSLSPT